MPWQEIKRLTLVRSSYASASAAYMTMTTMAEHYGISRQTGYAREPRVMGWRASGRAKCPALHGLL